MNSPKAMLALGEAIPLQVLTSEDGRFFHGVVTSTGITLRESDYFTSAATAQEMLEVTNQGAKAYEAGKALETNPYASSPAVSAYWETGWWGV